MVLTTKELKPREEILCIRFIAPSHEEERKWRNERYGYHQTGNAFYLTLTENNLVLAWSRRIMGPGESLNPLTFMIMHTGSFVGPSSLDAFLQWCWTCWTLRARDGRRSVWNFQGVLCPLGCWSVSPRSATTLPIHYLRTEVYRAVQSKSCMNWLWCFWRWLRQIYWSCLWPTFVHCFVSFCCLPLVFIVHGYLLCTATLAYIKLADGLIGRTLCLLFWTQYRNHIPRGVGSIWLPRC